MYSKTLLIRFIRLDLLEQGGQENHRASCGDCCEQSAPKFI